MRPCSGTDQLHHLSAVNLFWHVNGGKLIQVMPDTYLCFFQSIALLLSKYSKSLSRRFCSAWRASSAC